MSLDFRGQRNIFSDRIDLMLVENSMGMKSVATQIIFKTLDEGTYVDPILRLETNDAQKLMDELWQCGLRPTEGTGSAGSLAATERHLEDMRKLVFKGK